MKKTILLGSLILIAGTILQSCSIFNFKKEKGNKNIISEVYTINDYSAIIAKGMFSIVYEQKEGAPYLRVETDSNMLDYIDIDSNGTTLNIEIDKNGQPSVFKIHTNSEELKKIRLSGAGTLSLKDSISSNNLSIACSGANKVTIDNLDAQSINIEGSGSSSIHMEQVLTKKLSVDGSGSTKIEAKGKALEADFNISGSGKIEALELQTQSTKCKISGSGSINISCEESLDISISGSGRIKYKGNASINQKVSGSGKIEKI